MQPTIHEIAARRLAADATQRAEQYDALTTLLAQTESAIAMLVRYGVEPRDIVAIVARVAVEQRAAAPVVA